MKRLLAFVTVIAACGNVPEARDFNESLVAARSESCKCNGHALLLFPSEGECLAEFPPSEGEQACVEALFKSLDPDFGPHLECRTAANQRYASCLGGKTCSDLARIDCVQQLADEEEDCPDFPSEVQQELTECLN